MPPKLDLTGETFGLLTAIREIKKRDSRGRVIWHCQCKCGGKKNVATGDLRYLAVRSCGCIYRIDLSGQVYGRLTVIRETKQKKNNRYLWECVCECGNSILVRRDGLTSGGTKSCGCLNRERASEVHTIHGGTRNNRSHLYRVWLSMRKRCSDMSYKYYAGRGIEVCLAWKDFEVFRDWALAHPTYEVGKQIDRIDNDCNYEPSNCRWATPKENARNTSRTRWFTIDGETKSLAEFQR